MADFKAEPRNLPDIHIQLARLVVGISFNMKFRQLFLPALTIQIVSGMLDSFRLIYLKLRPLTG